MNERSHIVGRFGRALASAVVVVAAVAGLRCGGDESAATPGRRVLLETRVTAGPEAASPFTTSAGWSVALSKIAIATGAFYYFDGAPLFAAAITPSRARVFGGWLGLGVAHAHPGHYAPGEARGQMTEPFSADLALGEAEYPAGAGITGVFRSARFSFAAPAAGPLADALGGHAVVLEGRASKGTVTRGFRAIVDLADLGDAAGEPKRDGCAFEEVEVARDGTVTVVVKPSVWFDQVDLEKLPASADVALADMPRDGAPFKALVRGMKSSTGYAFSYAPGER